MIKEAIDYLLKQVNHEIQEVNGAFYHVNPDGVKEIVKPLRKVVSAFSVSTLRSLVEYINEQPDPYETEKRIVLIQDPKSVIFMSNTKDRIRDTYIKADAITPAIKFDMFFDVEKFNIMLQSCFLQNDDRDKILQVVGTIKEETVRTTGDDGITQTVTAKAGIARYDDVQVPNPVILFPCRTFVEVAQPASKFVFRMQNGPAAAIFEADAGAWRNEAIANIKQYLKDAIKADNVIILG